MAHTIVDGKLLMKDRQLLTANEGSIIAEAQDFANQVRKTVIASGEVVK